MSELAIQSVGAVTGELSDMPIEPSWIEDGDPVARGDVLVQSSDKLLSSGLWSCTTGKFRWEFGWDEFVHILEGRVTPKQWTSDFQVVEDVTKPGSPLVTRCSYVVESGQPGAVKA